MQTEKNIPLKNERIKIRKALSGDRKISGFRALKGNKRLSGRITNKSSTTGGLELPVVQLIVPHIIECDALIEWISELSIGHEDVKKLCKCFQEALHKSPNFIDRTDWTESHSITDILIWQVSEIRRLSLFDSVYVTSDFYENGAEFNLLAHYEYYNPNGYCLISVKNIALLRYKNKKLHDLMMDALIILTRNLSVQLWDDGHGYTIYESMLEWEECDGYEQAQIDDAVLPTRGFAKDVLDELKADRTITQSLDDFKECHPSIYSWAKKLYDILEKDVTLNNMDFYPHEFMVEDCYPISVIESYSLVYDTEDSFGVDYGAMLDDYFGNYGNTGFIHSANIKRDGWDVPDLKDRCVQLNDFLVETSYLFNDDELWTKME